MDDDRNIQDDDMEPAIGNENLNKAQDIFGEDVFTKDKGDAAENTQRINIKGDNQFEPKSLREADANAQMVVQSEIPERLLVKQKLNAKTMNEVLTNAYTTEVEDDVKIASEFIYMRMREL